MKRLDVVIIIAILVISLASYFAYNMSLNRDIGEKYVVISIKGEVYKTIPLVESASEIMTLSSELGTNVINIEDGAVRVIEASCPDKLCIMDGKIYRPGEVLVCLPNQVVIEIKGQEQGEVDALTY